eukprot:4432127-Lingulodinium_polyedra.AAC.1
MACACVAHFAALKQRSACLTASLSSVSQSARRRCGLTRASLLQRAEMRHVHTYAHLVHMHWHDLARALT